jgi:hypothetical protein
MSTYNRRLISFLVKAVFDSTTNMIVTNSVKVGITFYWTAIRDIPLNKANFTSGKVAYTK